MAEPKTIRVEFEGRILYLGLAHDVSVLESATKEWQLVKLEPERGGGCREGCGKAWTAEEVAIAVRRDLAWLR